MQPILDTYRKDRKYGAGHGYGRQITGGAWTPYRGTAPASLILHATHGRPGSTSAAEAAFLRDSPDVSAHYLVGRAGEVYQILPDDMLAWHAGDALPPFTNAHSLGIEIHAATTEPLTAAQLATLRDLVRGLAALHKIDADRIASHRAVALPPGRKSDPAQWPEPDLRAWVAALFTTPAPYTPDSPILAAPGASLAALTARVPTGAYTSRDVAWGIVPAYWRVCLGVGVDPVVALAQLCHETGGLESWWCQRPRRNPAGLGVTGATLPLSPTRPGPDWQADEAAHLWRQGLAFDAWDPQAAQAHVGRLLAYALPEGAATSVQQVLITKALALRPVPAAYRGIAPTLAGLGGTWAVPGTGYADALARWANRLAKRVSADAPA